MKKIFVIADHLWGTVTIRTVTDKDIVLHMIKRRLEDFVDNMDGFDRERDRGNCEYYPTHGNST